jgi:hypothetical protein
MMFVSGIFQLINSFVARRSELPNSPVRSHVIAKTGYSPGILMEFRDHGVGSAVRGSLDIGPEFSPSPATMDLQPMYDWQFLLWMVS